MTILGTLAGSAAVSLILTHRSLTDCLAVGSGFGYYSLSSIFITEYKGAELGTIALLANISREILTLLAAPLLVRWFGNLAPISAGGGNYDGHHTAHHYTNGRTTVCSCLHLPRICSGFQRSVPCDTVLFYLILF